MMIAAEGSDWQRFESLGAKAFAKTLLGLAANVDPQRLRSHPRKPKVVTRKGYVSR